MTVSAPSGSLTLIQSPVPEGLNGQSVAVSHMVLGILSYTHWPLEPATIRLCLAGTPRWGGQLEDMVQPSGRTVTVRLIDASGGLPMNAGCDALYLGHMGPAEQSNLIERAHGQPVVTIAEDDPTCRSGVMFCLDLDADRLSFQLDLDAVSRGTVRIDPRVLLLSRRSEHHF